MPTGYTETSQPIKNAWLAVDMSRPEAANAYQEMNQIHFTYWPEEITDSVAPNWEQVEVLGRAEPYHIYANTGARTIPVEFTFFAQGSFTRFENISGAIEQEVLSKVRFLRSLAYPLLGSDGLIRRPATCRLKLGGIADIRVIMADAPEVTYSGPWEPDDVLPYQAQVSCTFTEVRKHPENAEEVLNGSVSPGVGVSREEFLSAVTSAISVWVA